MADGSDEPRRRRRDGRAAPETAPTSSRRAATCGAAGRSAGRSLKRLMSRTAGLTLHWFAGVPTHDPTNNFKLYSRRFLDAITIESTAGFELAPRADGQGDPRRPAQSPRCRRPGATGRPARATSSSGSGCRTTCTGISSRSAIDCRGAGGRRRPLDDAARPRHPPGRRRVPPDSVGRGASSCRSCSRSAAPTSDWLRSSIHAVSDRTRSTTRKPRGRWSTAATRGRSGRPAPCFAGPPTMLLPFVPFVPLPGDVTRIVWVGGSLVLAILVLRHLRLPGWWLGFPPIFHAILLGHPEVLVLWLLVFGGPSSGLAPVNQAIRRASARSRSSRWRAIAIGLAVVVLTAPLLPWRSSSRACRRSRRPSATQTNGDSTFGAPVLMAIAVVRSPFSACAARSGSRRHSSGPARSRSTRWCRCRRCHRSSRSSGRSRSRSAPPRRHPRRRGRRGGRAPLRRRPAGAPLGPARSRWRTLA